MHRVVGGVDVQNDPARRPLLRPKEVVHQQSVDPLGPVRDLVVALIALSRKTLQAVQRALARKGRTPFAPRGCKLAGKDLEHGVKTQTLVVVDVLIAKRQRVHPLPHQCPQLMLHPPRVPAVLKAGGQAGDEIHAPLGLAQQESARIRGDRPAVGSGRHVPATQALKLHPFWDTLCMSQVGLLCSGNPLIKKSLPEKGRLGSSFL